MIKVAVTQRVEEVKSYKERRDCIDQRWASLLESFGIEILPVPNSLSDITNWISGQNINGLILTGGNDLSHLPDASNLAVERDVTESLLLDFAKKNNIPVLGVCRGMQMMNFWLGGKMELVDGHIATEHVVSALPDNLWFDHNFVVNSFHGWGFKPEQLAPELVPLVCAGDGTVEAFKHISLPWFGIMWHPERDVSISLQDEKLFKLLFIKN